MSFGSHHHSTHFFWRTYNPRALLEDGVDIRVSHVMLSCADQHYSRHVRLPSGSSHFHIILENEDGARFLFLGPLIIFEDGAARLAPIFVNVARKLEAARGWDLGFLCGVVDRRPVNIVRLNPPLSTFSLTLNAWCFTFTVPSPGSRCRSENFLEYGVPEISQLSMARWRRDGFGRRPRRTPWGAKNFYTLEGSTTVVISECFFLSFLPLKQPSHHIFLQTA